MVAPITFLAISAIWGGLELGSSYGVLGDVSVNSETANSSLSDAEISFTPHGGATISARADSNGWFDLNLPSGTFEGEFDVLKTYSTASKDINALDAL
ncbi:hypothetical protein [Ruegeria atlantica]|uniref:hypothetical protein n=1 Tax=Ruegeria atlantica TaxID=81569 RepID=UPI00071C3B78|nr:hypothetical protein [Ruegeria atlantica]